MITPPDSPILREAVTRALGEDRGPMDVTSMAVIPEQARASARIFAKEPCVLAGLIVASRVFNEEDAGLTLTETSEDGATLEKGATVLEIKGRARSILTAERTALNFIQQLSGVATRTRQFVMAVEGTGCRILDTRKTAPAQRHLQKYAVRCGGGTNHRMGLYDMVMMKDNHLALMGPGSTWAEAVARCRDLAPEIKIEIEADTLEQVALLAELPIDRILLDNMSNEQMTEAVRIIAKRCETEASGNMTLERVQSVAATGVDYISIGALTHSVTAIDFSLELVPA
ncbi:MAG: carboxylating nicotinate-nucleotide diphosphorylase [Candidatus Methylacidiphilales bacterium]|nr:carboxylating nicotinate-nucleotide diphosphorylase [Candidatus Methylacidiphilales bacterium]